MVQREVVDAKVALCHVLHLLGRHGLQSQQPRTYFVHAVACFVLRHRRGLTQRALHAEYQGALHPVLGKLQFKLGRAPSLHAFDLLHGAAIHFSAVLFIKSRLNGKDANVVKGVVRGVGRAGGGRAHNLGEQARGAAVAHDRGKYIQRQLVRMADARRMPAKYRIALLDFG